MTDKPKKPLEELALEDPAGSGVLARFSRNKVHIDRADLPDDARKAMYELVLYDLMDELDRLGDAGSAASYKRAYVTNLLERHGGKAGLDASNVKQILERAKDTRYM